MCLEFKKLVRKLLKEALANNKWYIDMIIDITDTVLGLEHTTATKTKPSLLHC